jgi:hypothetical protein
MIEDGEDNDGVWEWIHTLGIDGLGISWLVASTMV